nr:hypothetical protein [Tanacetum cinerariifolium]
MLSSQKQVSNDFIRHHTNHTADRKVDLEADTESLTDMFWKMDDTLSFRDFIHLAITEMTSGRRHAYVRLFLYPTKKAFDENGRKRYFYNSIPTGFRELFRATGLNGDLVGTWIGFHVLTQAILRVIRMTKPCLLPSVISVNMDFLVVEMASGFPSNAVMISRRWQEPEIELVEENKVSGELEEDFNEKFKEEEEDNLEYFNTFPTREELEYYGWLLKNPQPSWVRAKVRK